MKIAVASGKGGTGKTTLATNLAVSIAAAGTQAAFLDCDVEEPNGRIFLEPVTAKQIDVTVPVPQVDFDKCTYCGECSAMCEYNAIAVLGKTVKIFPSLCHSCGGCTVICPEKAIDEYPRKIGRISIGTGLGVDFYEGRLNVGEAISPPVTRALKKLTIESPVIIIDAPPGTSCPVIEAINDTDFVVLVTEPTPFGLNDLKLAVGMVREMGLPFGVVINRSDIGDTRTEEYCRSEDIEVLLRLPYDSRLAEFYSRGQLMVKVNNNYEKILLSLYEKIAGRIKAYGISNSQR